VSGTQLDPWCILVQRRFRYVFEKEKAVSDYVRTISVGSATVTVVNVGDLTLSLSEIMNVSEDEWRPRYAADFERPLSFPSQCIHISLPGASVLVDANDYAVSSPPDSPYAPPDYQPPPGLMAQLLEKGIYPENITHVVITHAHLDHYCGVTTQRDGHYVPCFPNARCYLGKADWEHPETREALQTPDSVDSRTFGVLHQLGLLELVEGDRDLTPEVRIIAASGESHGHQLVRVHSQGQTLYCLGDLYHHPVEVEQPSWMAEWANTGANLASRHALAEAALAENALLIATHIPTIGRLARTETGVRWVAV
jgi:glyoxylase-like metal-dependent hydrolase (beta-lactamase superfamily II)